MSSHWTQKVADCRGTKLASRNVEPYTVLENMLWNPHWKLHWRLEGKYKTGLEKVPEVVPVLWKKSSSGGGNCCAENCNYPECFGRTARNLCAELLLGNFCWLNFSALNY